MSENLKKTQLNQWHKEHGGRMVPFAGWEMPVQYKTGPLQEHHSTRKAAGLFDIDHMGQIEIRGEQAEEFVNMLVTYDVSLMELNDAHYALFCYADGGVIDDLFVYRLTDPENNKLDYFFLVVNASNLSKDVSWVQFQSHAFDVQVKDVSEETYMLAFQGPKAPEILNRLTNVELTSVPRFTAVQGTFKEKVPMLLGRTGYTGEDGFELFFPAEHALYVWNEILKEGDDEGVMPIGLAARDSLRFEPCMPLYGHELSQNITPVEARLNFAITFEKDFIGRDVLLKQKLERPEKILVGFELIDRGVAREGYPVLFNDQQVGLVTTGMYSPTTSRYLGMAFVPREISSVGTEIEIKIRNKGAKARIIKRPFYKPAYRS
ncbi:MAG: glycine cleavage system aminomethyltransferase GcvT [Anaerolineales bacterium]